MIDFRKKEVLVNPSKDKFCDMLRSQGFITKNIEGVDVWRKPNSNLLYVKTHDKKFSVHLFCMEDTYLVKSQLYNNFDYSRTTNLIEYLIENKYEN